MSIRHPLRALVATAALLTAASATHAGIALQTYTPGASPVDYTATTALLDTHVVAGEGGSIPFFHGKWFSFTMPHAASLTGITLPINFFSKTAANATVNFGFWFGSDPASSSFGGATIPKANIVPGLIEYSFDFAPSALLSAGQLITIDIEIIGATTANTGIDGTLFLSNTPGTTHEKSLGVIFGPTSNFLPAIQIRDNAAPEPASLPLLAAALLPLTRRKK